MAPNRTTEEKTADRETRRSAVAMEPTDPHRVRLARVSEFEQQGVSATQPFAAFLAVIQAELFRTVAALEDAVHQSLGQPLTTTACLAAAAHPTSNYLRAVRQIAQNARLQFGESASAGPSPNKPPVRPVNCDNSVSHPAGPTFKTSIHTHSHRGAQIE
jgi:hypothetical protein